MALKLQSSVVESGPDNDIEDSYRLHRRFDRMGRLVGDRAMERLLGSQVTVIGLGGVGSHAAEALVRSGVGRVTLVDFDRVCITNTNRQLQAMKGEIGKHKSEVLAERLRRINPQAVIESVTRFYNADSSEEILSLGADWIVDAIDNVTAKCHLLSECREWGQAVVCSTGAAGRMDPTSILTADLSETIVDPLAASVRKMLRSRHDFPSTGSFGVPSVYSTEPVAAPKELHYDQGKGFRCVCPGGKNAFHSCEDRNVIHGTAGFVTGAFGLVTASLVVRSLVAEVTEVADA